VSDLELYAQDNHKCLDVETESSRSCEMLGKCFLSKPMSDGVWWDHAVMALDRDVNFVAVVGEVEN
jgi:hypothetical protein